MLAIETSGMVRYVSIEIVYRHLLYRCRFEALLGKRENLINNLPPGLLLLLHSLSNLICYDASIALDYQQNGTLK